MKKNAADPRIMILSDNGIFKDQYKNSDVEFNTENNEKINKSEE